MVDILLGVIIGYVLAHLPKLVSLFANREHVVEKKAREPTEAEQRQARRLIREYANFLAYDGTEQDDIIV